MKIEILDLAAADLIAGGRFYERQEPGIGSYFLNTLFSEIDSLMIHAGVHRKMRGYHRMLSRRFPYAIFYKFEGDKVQVWRVLDCRRDPVWIRKQLTPG